MLFNATALFTCFGLYVPYFYISDYSTTQANMSPSIAFYMVTVLSAGSAFGRILPNFFADKTGLLNMITICTCAAFILAYCWLAIANTPGIIVICVLYGFFSGTFVSLQPTSVVTLSPSLGIFGTRMGMSTLCVGLGTLVGNPVAGAIVEKGSWVGVRLFCACALVVGTVFVAGARVVRSRRVMDQV